MFQNIVGIVVLACCAYWFWTGPYQNMNNVSYEDQLKTNSEDMARCMRSRKYLSNSGASQSVRPEQLCAEKYNLYEEDGRWHRYNDTRPLALVTPYTGASTA